MVEVADVKMYWFRKENGEYGSRLSLVGSRVKVMMRNGVRDIIGINTLSLR